MKPPDFRDREASDSQNPKDFWLGIIRMQFKEGIVMTKKLCLKPHSTGVRGKKQEKISYRKFYHNSPGSTSLHKLVLGRNLSDFPGGGNWLLTAFLIGCVQHDLATMSEEELEILAAGVPCGVCDA